MGSQIPIIRDDIRHDQDGPRVDTPGASAGGPGPGLPLLRFSSQHTHTLQRNTLAATTTIYHE